MQVVINSGYSQVPMPPCSATALREPSQDLCSVSKAESRGRIGLAALLSGNGVGSDDLAESKAVLSVESNVARLSPRFWKVALLENSSQLLKHRALCAAVKDAMNAS